MTVFAYVKKICGFPSGNLIHLWGGFSRFLIAYIFRLAMAIKNTQNALVSGGGFCGESRNRGVDFIGFYALGTIDTNA